MRNTFVDFQLIIAVITCPGWQPGIEGTAADWDEDWDKFEDEGIFCFFKKKSLFYFRRCLD